MSRNFSLTGYVLARRNLGEADRLLIFYSREQGKLTASARGVRRAGAKLTSQLEPYAEISMQCVETRGLPIVTGAQVMRSLQPAGDYDVLVEAQAVLELTNLTMDDGQIDEMWYEHLGLVLSTLADPLSSVEARQLAWLSLMVHSLDVLGLTPQLPETERDYGLDIREGNFHAGRTGAQLTSQGLKLWRFLLRAPVGQRLSIKHADQAASELTPIIEQFWGYHTGLTLKSRSLA